MSTILDKIVKSKQAYVSEKKSLFPTKLLEQSIYFESKPVSLKKYVEREDKQGIIAEIKRKSPSKGVINKFISVEKVSIGYMQAGASALSVLTDMEFFGGSNEDLKTARKFNFCPILRKDFIIDEYQIIEAKSIGADAILLIAAILDTNRMKELADFAHSLGLEVLLEVHNEEELNKAADVDMDLLGINNRDLKTFEVSLDTSKQLSKKIGSGKTLVSESGISSVEAILDLRSHGFKGFLIGQNFMEESMPDVACKKFIQELKFRSVRV